MAKNNNLTDYLTDLANAIREKKGITDQINPQDFSAEIASIETGGGGGGAVAASAGAINFRDYDGTILHSYSKDEFLALSALPELPTQPGLICQEWNYTFEDAQSYVAEYGKLDVGATYITDDGKTRLYITIAAEGRMTIPLKVQQTVANGVVVDWGDGSATETFASTSATTLSHTYSEIGDYVITFEVISGILTFVGSSSYGFIASTLKVYSNMLQKVEIGKGMKSVGDYAFYYCYSLSSIVIPNGVTYIGTYSFNECTSLSSIVIPNGVKLIGSNPFQKCYSLSSIVIPNGVTKIAARMFESCYSLSSIVIPNSVTMIADNAFTSCTSLSSIVIPNSVTSINTYAFNACNSLSSIVIPNSVTSIGTYAFYACYSLSSIVIPNGVKLINTYAFNACYSLSSIVIPNSVTMIGSDSFYNCYSLSSIVIPNSVTSIKDSAFYKCYSLSSIVIPNGVTSIGGSAFYCCTSLSSIVIPNSVTSVGSKAFYGCSSLAILDFRSHTSVPTLSNYNAFSSVSSDLKIVVPDALYDEWIAATNWSSNTRYIVKASEFNG